MKQRIGLLLVCTGRYDCFIPQLMEGIEKYFFPNNELTIFIFSDKKGLIKPNSERIKVVETEIEHKPFPYSTLYRYKYFLMREPEIRLKCDYVFYIDVDCKIISEVNIELPEVQLVRNQPLVIATKHPAYSFADKSWWGSQCVDVRSKAYLPKEDWGKQTGGYYCCGGFQGGSSLGYLILSSIINARIIADEINRVTAEWHDESHFNFIINSPNLLTFKKYDFASNAVYDEPIKIMVLENDYCCQEGRETQTTKIIALNKNHEELRN